MWVWVFDQAQVSREHLILWLPVSFVYVIRHLLFSVLAVHDNDEVEDNGDIPNNDFDLPNESDPFEDD
jgi:hypothetical protein